MKNLLYLVVLSTLLGLSGCALNQMVKLAEQQNLNVTPNPLEVHADSVKFEMSADLPVKMLKKGKVYTLKTFNKQSVTDKELTPIQFRSEDFPNANTSQPKLSNLYKMAYESSMKNSTVEVQGVASDPANGKFKESPRMVVANGVITTSKLVQPVYHAIYADHGYNNQEELIPVVVDFFFDQGRSTLNYSEMKSNRGKQFDAFIAEKNVTRTVTITGSHSPEGQERINSRLAKDRAETIMNYYKKQMNKYDYKGMTDSINFIVKDVVQDWQAFKDSLAQYDGVPSTEKSAYLDIVNGRGSFEEKEKQMQKLSTYKKVLKELYPKLRLANTNILKVKDKKTDVEISVLSKMIVEGTAPLDTLSEEELMYSATLTPSLEEKESIYAVATKKSGNWAAHNNLGVVYMTMAMENDMNENAEKAQAQFEIAANKNANATVHANLASVALMKGNPYKSNDHLNEVEGLSTDDEASVNGVRTSVNIMIADYSNAAKYAARSSDNAVNLFNKGLAQVLNMNYQSAMTSFREATNKDSDMAVAYYAAAIASARLDNLDEVVRKLKSAVEANPSYKEEALQDLEFQKYFANQEFRDALQ